MIDEAAAAAALPSAVYDYIAAGAGDEFTARANLAAWSDIRLLPHVLRDVSHCDPSTTVLGTLIPTPIGIAPTGRHLLIHPGGESATAAAAAASGVPFILSFFSTQSLEEVAAAAPDGIRWLQVPAGLPRRTAAEIVDRAQRAGYRALVVTVDQPVGGTSPRAARNPVAVPEHLRLPHVPGSPRAVIGFDELWEQTVVLDEDRTFGDLAAFIAASPLPVLAKGVVRADDARRALDAGVSGIIVSNHAGRHLDHVLPTAEALGDVVAAVDQAVEVYVDGGIRKPGDVMKALCLGARAVFIGQPSLWGLAVDGEDGVRAVLEDLGRDLRTDMKLLGVARADELTRDLVRVPLGWGTSAG